MNIGSHDPAVIVHRIPLQCVEDIQDTIQVTVLMHMLFNQHYSVESSACLLNF